jgi:hypothetical protein
VIAAETIQFDHDLLYEQDNIIDKFNENSSMSTGHGLAAMKAYLLTLLISIPS